MILSDLDLRSYIRSGRLYIHPLDEDQIRENGVDLRLGDEICILRRSNEVLDPEDPGAPRDIVSYYACRRASEYVIEPGERYLITTMEYIRVPPELMGFVELRSTFARLGLMIPPTIIDGGFEGQITVELLGSSFPIKLRAGTRFLHVVFAKVSSPIERPYSGRYMRQVGATLPRLPP